MSTATHLMTAEELLRRSSELGRCELIRGELIQMSPAGHTHGRVSHTFGRHVGNFVADHHLGIVYAAETGFILERDPDTVRAPDVAFVAHGRTLQQRDDGFFLGAPDFLVEVVSPRDTKRNIDEKVQMWLDHGAKLVWTAYSNQRSVRVHDAKDRDHPKMLSADDIIDGGDVLPGFRKRVGDFFP